MLCVIIPFKNNTGFAFFVIHFSKRSLVPALVLKNSNTLSHRTIKDHNYNRFFPNTLYKGYFSISMRTSCNKTKKATISFITLSVELQYYSTASNRYFTGAVKLSHSSIKSIWWKKGGVLSINPHTHPHKNEGPCRTYKPVYLILNLIISVV